MNALVAAGRRAEGLVGPAAVAAACVIAGVAASRGSLAIVVALVIVIAGVAAVAFGSEYVLVLLVASAPIGLEQATAGKRTLLPDLGGWGVSSLRLGILLAASLGLIALRGLTRRLNVEEFAYLGLVVYLTIALAVSPAVFEGVRFVAKIAVVLLAWLAFGWVVRRFGEDFVWKLLLGTLAFAIVADVAMLALGAGYQRGLDFANRFGGITGAPAAGSLCVGLLALVALYRWLERRQKLALALYLAAWVPIFASLTRTSVVAFGAGSVLLTILLGRIGQAVAIVALLGVVTFTYTPLRERTAWGETSHSWKSIAHSIEVSGTANLNTGGRETLWKPLWRQWHEHPIAGSGTGASAKALAATTDDNVTQAHSDYLALLVNGGVIALALWLLALGGLFVRFAVARGAASVAAAGILVYLIAAITDNSIEMYANVGIPLALLIAVGLEAGRPLQGRQV